MECAPERRAAVMGVTKQTGAWAQSGGLSSQARASRLHIAVGRVRMCRLHSHLQQAAGEQRIAKRRLLRQRDQRPERRRRAAGVARREELRAGNDAGQERSGRFPGWARRRARGRAGTAGVQVRALAGELRLSGGAANVTLATIVPCRLLPFTHGRQGHFVLCAAKARREQWHSSSSARCSPSPRCLQRFVFFFSRLSIRAYGSTGLYVHCGSVRLRCVGQHR